MKDPADRLVEAARRHGQPEGHMSRRPRSTTRRSGDVTPPPTEADEAPDWASDLEFVPAESPDDLIQALHPGAKPYWR